MRKLTIFLPLFLLLTAERCPDALRKIAEGLNTAAVAVGELQSTVIEASDTGVITKESSDAFIEEVTVKILTAIGKANTTVDLLAAMEEQGRDDLLEVLPPVIDAVKETLAEDSLGMITNEGTQAAVQLGLQSILATLNTIQAVTEVSK